MNVLKRHASTLALAGAVEPAWLLGASVIFGTIRAGYTADHAISELGQQGSELAVAWNVIGFGGAATLYVIFAIALAQGVGRAPLFWLTLAQAIALAGGATFSCDPGCPQMMVTPVGWGHTFFGLTYFMITVLVPGIAALSFRRIPEWRSLTVLSTAAGLLLVVLFVAGPAVFGAAHIGLWQRTTLVISGAWTIIVSVRLHRVLKHQEQSWPRGALMSEPHARA